MPDGGAVANFTYQRAVRGRFAPLFMITGPAGTGKTMSALRLATGMARGGKICVADTDNSRARLYADEFQFEHLDLREPFRPKLFEDAAVAAQKQGAAVLIVDNFSAEHTGPGGLLEWFEEELIRMARGDPAKMESLKMLAWAKVKPSHKHMRERLYQLNMPLILCCAAERKIAMVKQTEGKDRGKVIPVDQGFQPIVGGDIPFAMTASLMLLDVKRPGVPTPIKALLPALKPIIALDKPIDEATGEAIAAWARGDGGKASGRPARTAPPPPDQDTPDGSSEGPPVHPEDEPPGVVPPEPPPPEEPPEPPPEPEPPPPDTPPEPRELIEARRLAGLFAAVKERREHLALVDDQTTRQDIEWLKRNRKGIFDTVLNPAIKASWTRTDPNAQTRESLV